ncbi:MAG: hypothetical protein WC532_01180 [Candidatus Omnitrophota bacterium]
MRRNVYLKAVTLLELIMAIVLLSMISLGFLSIDLFSRNSVLSADRQAKVQNSVAFALAHMTKNIGNAIGDKNHPPVSFPTNVVVGGVDTYPGIIITVDGNNNGLLEFPTDGEVSYFYNETDHSLNYCSDCSSASNVEKLSNKVVSDLSSTYVTYNNTTNYIEINLWGRWDPDNPATPQNPEVKLYSYVKMPLVSTN